MGASDGDSLQVTSPDRTLAADGSIPIDNYLELELNTSNSKSRDKRIKLRQIPSELYLRLWPTTNAVGRLDGLRFSLLGTQPNDHLNYILVGAEHSAFSAPLSVYTDTNNQISHIADVGFIPKSEAGYARVVGSHKQQFIDLNVDYRLQQALASNGAIIFSNDGNFKLSFDPTTPSISTTHFLISSLWGIPGPAPIGLEVVGEAYEITSSTGSDNLEKPAILTLRYDETTGITFKNLAIYRWDFVTSTWEKIGENTNEEFQEVSVAVDRLGVYALIGTVTNQARATTNNCGSVIRRNGNYLPIITER